MICEEEDSSFSEYMEETFTHRKGIEDRQTAKIENCLKGQTMVSADGRKVLVEWLAKVQRHLNLSFESFFLAVALVDRFLKTTPISSDCLQLTGITALLVSSKMEDIYPPLIADLIRLSANAYTRVHVIMMERYMLSRLRFDIATSTPLFFFDWYSAKMRTVSVSNEKIAKSRALARFILEKAIADYDLSQLRASHLALATLKLVNDAFLIPAFGITSMCETDTLKTIIRLEIVMKENLKETPLDKVYSIYSLD
ncbi:unnamed protein product [Dimorphilus gyrociliatus]|uniref:Cyclin-like domain-containing protein n=1 Tax=Dimorphilus gyrociliatus TaxID=2664684 RepID=A0A7I8W199_9ANNE|nr:unnamed protein product [Dimorphilus gyrociliatus]